VDAETVVEVVQEEEMLSVEETRRRFVLEYGIRYIPGDELAPPIRESLEILNILEQWLIDGTIPAKPEDPKAKFTVVGKP